MRTNHKPLAWVTGAGGLIGNAIVASAPDYASQWEVRGITRPDVDLSDFGVVEALFRKERPELVIHCAAISRNPVCEADPALARRVNVDVTARLAALCQNARFIFFSTDLVFDGMKGDYVETDPVAGNAIAAEKQTAFSLQTEKVALEMNDLRGISAGEVKKMRTPLSVYSATKIAAERIVSKNPRHTIVRTSLTSGVSPTGDRSFEEEMCRAWGAGRTLNLFTDEFRCPMDASVTAHAIWELAKADAPGIFHLAGAEKLSRYEIGLLVAKKHPEVTARITPSSRADYKGPPRPADTSLNCAKIHRLLSFPLPSFSDWVEKALRGG